MERADESRCGALAGVAAPQSSNGPFEPLDRNARSRGKRVKRRRFVHASRTTVATMTTMASAQVTELLHAWGAGDEAALD